MRLYKQPTKILAENKFRVSDAASERHRERFIKFRGKKLSNEYGLACSKIIIEEEEDEQKIKTNNIDDSVVGGGK